MKSTLHNGRIQVAVAKPQHHSKPVQSYVSEKEVREILLALGVASETADDYLLKLFPQLYSESRINVPSDGCSSARAIVAWLQPVKMPFKCPSESKQVSCRDDPMKPGWRVLLKGA